MTAPLVKLAFDWAGVWHAGQLRKYPNVAVPYMSHVAGVAAILSRHGFEEEVVAAGALHDVLEDCEVTYEDLAAKFGVVVAELVRHSTEEDRTARWEVRKQRYLERFSTKPWPAQAITLADKVDNLESIVVSSRFFGDPWPLFKRGRDTQLARFRDLLVRARAVSSHPLVDEYERALLAASAV